MNENNSFDNLKYNSCISKGICSINPRTSALQNILALYLNLCAKYCIKLYKKNALDNRVKDFILNTVAVSVYNPEFTENCFMEVISKLKGILPDIVSKYNSLYGKNDFEGENILSSYIFKKCEDIVDAIKFGEYIFKTKVSNVPTQTRNMLNILLIISKSISINLLDLQSYGADDDSAFLTLLEILYSLKKTNCDIKKLKMTANKGAEVNTGLMQLLHNEQENRYGEQDIAEISYTTTPSKAVLAVGSNIRELETILEALKDTEIEVYTHDDMMVAHTFPKFREYKNLKGQYGHGVENCLIDFATFPGPIILTKHSLHNIENLYRGLLFTTDINFYKGVIKIENNNFFEVIKAANSAKGFKTGKVCETVTVGYNYEKCIELIEEKLSSNLYKKVIIIGVKDYSSEQKDYFKSLIRQISENILIISFSYDIERDNILYFNTCFDSFAVVRLTMYLLKKGLPLNVFLPKCGRNTITEMIYFAEFENTVIYMGECEPILINPAMKSTIQEIFNIKSIGLAKEDSKYINEL